MRNLLFTLLMLVGSSMVMAQGTYYWVGTTATTNYNSTAGWNTKADGTGTERTAYNAGDVLIVKGNDKEVQLNVTAANIHLAQLQVLDGAKVALYDARSDATGAWYFYLDGYVDGGSVSHKGLLVDNGSTFTLATLQAAFNVVLTTGGDVNNSSTLNNIVTGATTRLIAKVAESLVFDGGSICNFACGEGFGQAGVAEPTLASLNPAIEAVVFKSGTSLYHKGAGNPFAGGANPNVKFETGSNYYYKTDVATSGTNVFKGRTFANLIIEGTYTSTNGEGFTQVDNLTIKSGGSLIYGGGTSVAQPVTGSIVVEGLLNTYMSTFVTLPSPAAPFTLETKSGSTVIVANAGGVEGAIVTTGTKTFDINTTYGSYLAITTDALFPAGIPKINGVAQVGGIVVNAGVQVSLGSDVNVLAGGKINLNATNNARIALGAYNLTLQPGVTIDRIDAAGNRIWVHEAGNLSVLGVSSTPIVVPIGTNNVIAPITLSAVNPSDFTLKSVAGATAGAGRPVAYVQATYTIARTSGTGNFTATLGWQAVSETGGFASLANNNISLYAYSGSAYSIAATSSADNDANTATATLSTGGTFIVGEGPNTLPVTLSAFTAQKQGNSALIKWATSSENNNSHFDIERSANGINFTVIGNRKGAGTTSAAQQYSYTDFSPASGNNYYRLVQYDLNGTPTIYEPQVLNFGYGTQGLAVQTSQNAQEVAFYVSSGVSGVAQVAVYAIDGKKVSEGKVNVEKGNNACTLNTPSLGRGVYTLVYQLGGESYRAKFVK